MTAEFNNFRFSPNIFLGSIIYAVSVWINNARVRKGNIELNAINLISATVNIVSNISAVGLL